MYIAYNEMTFLDRRPLLVSLWTFVHYIEWILSILYQASAKNATLM